MVQALLAEPGNKAAGSRAIEVPAVIRANKLTVSEPAFGKRRIAMRAAVDQNGGPPLFVAQKHQRLAEQAASERFALQLARFANDEPRISKESWYLHTIARVRITLFNQIASSLHVAHYVGGEGSTFHSASSASASGYQQVAHYIRLLACLLPSALGKAKSNRVGLLSNLPKAEI